MKFLLLTESLQLCFNLRLPTMAKISAGSSSKSLQRGGCVEDDPGTRNNVNCNRKWNKQEDKNCKYLEANHSDSHFEIDAHSLKI